MGETANIHADLTVLSATDSKLHALASHLHWALPDVTTISSPSGSTAREQCLDILATSARELFIESTDSEAVNVTDSGATVSVELDVDYLSIATTTWLSVMASYAVGSFEINDGFDGWKYELADGKVYVASAIIHYGPLNEAESRTPAASELKAGSQLIAYTPQDETPHPATVAATFDTRSAELAGHVGDWFTLLGPVSRRPYGTCTDGAQYWIRFADGTDILAFLEEITEERWPNHPEGRGLLGGDQRFIPQM